MPIPGVYTIISSDATGTVSMTVNYDPATGDLRDVGSPPAAVTIVNNTASAWPAVITTADGTFSRSIPKGANASFTAAQVLQASGIANVSQVQVTL